MQVSPGGERKFEKCEKVVGVSFFHGRHLSLMNSIGRKIIPHIRFYEVNSRIVLESKV